MTWGYRELGQHVDVGSLERDDSDEGEKGSSGCEHSRSVAPDKTSKGDAEALESGSHQGPGERCAESPSCVGHSADCDGERCVALVEVQWDVGDSEL